MRSIARLRAVVISQEVVFAGTPSRGQRSAAVTNASCAASSASSMSPRMPTSAASTRPHWSRKTSPTSGSLDNRAHLDPAVLPPFLEARCDLSRLVEIRELEHDQPSKELLAVDEWAVCEERLAVFYAHRGRCLGPLQTDGRACVWLPDDLCEGVLEALVLVRREHVPRDACRIDEQCVLHEVSSPRKLDPSAHLLLGRRQRQLHELADLDAAAPRDARTAGRHAERLLKIVGRHERVAADPRFRTAVPDLVSIRNRLAALDDAC